MNKTYVVIVAFIIIFCSSVIGNSTWVSLRDTTEGKPPTITVASSNDDITEIIVIVHGFFYEDSVIGNTTYRKIWFPDNASTNHPADSGKPELPKLLCSTAERMEREEILENSGPFSFL